MLRLALLALLSGASSLRVAPRRGLLLGGGAAAAAAVVGAPAPALADEGELSFAERARLEGRRKADARRAGFSEWTDKVGTLGGVEGQVTGPATAASSVTQSVGNLSPIKLKRAPDRTDADDRPLSEIMEDMGVPTVKFQMKRDASGSEDSESRDTGPFKMKR